MNRYVCIHGHFYQPPRENPWLEEIEMQESSYPFHDWNERISNESYAPNAASRILDNENRITAIVNNYASMSFNFGPTLLSWMENHDIETYKAIIEADKESMRKFSGHGAALAQVFNHIIMPLADIEDKRTQVIWGVVDFKNRFKREPEGMWLAETAADTNTLEVFAEQGIKFTILAPSQADSVRKIGEEKWEDVKGEKVDPKKPYLCKLPSGKEITIFFYDGPISQDLSFGGLLKNGGNFAKRLKGAFTREDLPQIVNVATDGETYGHHEKHGDMALAYCAHDIEADDSVKITIYGEFLEKHPPEYEVKITEPGSWSCAHGVERWRADCGCSSGMHPGWNQKWREPLREALDFLRDSLREIYIREAGEFVKDPMDLRNDYINLFSDREKNLDEFMKRNRVRQLSREERIRLLELLEMQKNCLYMYTSCGWFFDEISGIETTQIMKYAARAMQIARGVSGFDGEEKFLKILEEAPSNLPKFENGRAVYDAYVKPAVIDLLRVGVHYAVSSLFEDYQEENEIYCYEVKSHDYKKEEAGKQVLVTGKARMKSKITLEENEINFAVLHMGDHNLAAGVKYAKDAEFFEKMRDELYEAFNKTGIQEVIKIIENYYEGNTYSFWHLFRDEQEKILNQIFEKIFEETESFYRQIYSNNYQIMQVIKESNMYLPRAFLSAVEFIINLDLKRLLEEPEPRPDELKRTISEVKKWGVKLDQKMIQLAITEEVNDVMNLFYENPTDLELLGKIHETIKLINDLEIDVNLWKAQNMYFKIGEKYYRERADKKEKGEEESVKWIELYNSTGEYLRARFR